MKGKQNENSTIRKTKIGPIKILLYGAILEEKKLGQKKYGHNIT